MMALPRVAHMVRSMLVMLRNEEQKSVKKRIITWSFAPREQFDRWCTDTFECILVSLRIVTIRSIVRGASCCHNN